MEKYDIVIIGAGPSGVTSAIYAHRSNLNYILLEKGLIGGKINNAYEIENYPGYSKIEGSTLANKFTEQVKSLNLNFRRERVTSIEYFGEHNIYIQTNKEKYQAKTVIIAVGTDEKELDLPKANEFKGRGVSYCATCDGMFYKDKDVIVYGGGDSAITEATYLAKLAHHVTIISRHELRGEKKNIDKLHEFNNVSYISNSIITSIFGDDEFKGITYRPTHDEHAENKSLNADGIFVYIGSKPELRFLNHLDILNSKGFIETDRNFRTKVKGIYAIGDVIEKELRQIVTAASDGAEVISTIRRDLNI